ncbi:MAG TPA: hypothetical protein VEK11_00540 [Thermoanaerobaculia bacterium]|nr:hypothetical protein [Thermoanaerobaculia bacterium]
MTIREPVHDLDGMQPRIELRNDLLDAAYDPAAAELKIREQQEAVARNPYNCRLRTRRVISDGGIESFVDACTRPRLFSAI